MKTRIILLAILNILIWNSEAAAQTNYYKESGIIKGDGFTYQCVIGEFNKVEFYNVNNRFTGVPMRYKDGSDILHHSSLGEIVENNNDGDKIQDAINRVLTEDEKKMIKENHGIIGVQLLFDTQTGQCVDVIFDWMHGSCIDSIPPERFYKIEQELKRVTNAIPTKVGKTLNYIGLGWRYYLHH